MATRGRYDTSLQMFVEEGCDPDMQRLRFLRWLAERGELEHEVAGAPCGELSRVLLHVEPDAFEPLRSMVRSG